MCDDWQAAPEAGSVVIDAPDEPTKGQRMMKNQLYNVRYGENYRQVATGYLVSRTAEEVVLDVQGLRLEFDAQRVLVAKAVHHVRTTREDYEANRARLAEQAPGLVRHQEALRRHGTVEAAHKAGDL